MDTGATCSFLSNKLLHNWAAPDLGRTELPIRLADGTLRKLEWKWEAHVKVAGRSIPITFYILPGSAEEVILGLDFLSAASASFRIGQHAATLRFDSDYETTANQQEHGLALAPWSTRITCDAPVRRGPASVENITGTETPRQASGVCQTRVFTQAGSEDKRTESALEAKRSGNKDNQRPASTRGFPGTVSNLSEPAPDKEGDELPSQVGTRCCQVDSSLSAALPVSQPGGGSLADVPEDQQARIRGFLQGEIQKFERLKGTTDILEHRIIMKDDRPVKQRYYPRNPAMQAVIDEQVSELLDKGCIEPSHSPYSSPIVLVRKKNNTWRMCIDFRQINARSIPDAYPLPRIHHILNRLRNAQFISCLDLKNGYWQIPMAKDSRPFTAFTVPGRGLFQWKVMPFGLHSAPATFQRALDQVLGVDLEPYAFAYLDDIVVTAQSLEEHIRILKEVFRRLQAARLRINPDKCEFFKAQVKYLGHLVTREGIRTDPDKVAAIRELPAPRNIKELRRCLGMASWYRRFVPEFSRIVQPMTNLLKKEKKFVWQPEQQEAFDLLKRKLTEAPVLACPDFSQTFTLQTDASDVGIGAVLTQEIEGHERVIAYASRKLTGAEVNYSATEKECLAIIWGIHQMREYLEGYKFVVVTDHLALKWLNSIQSPTDRIARWALDLQQFQFEIRYRKGKNNVVADALSRQPVEGRTGSVDDTVYRIMVDSGVAYRCKWWSAMEKAVRERPETVPDYSLVNGQLYRRMPLSFDDEGDSWKLCVPRELREQVLRENHDAPAAGHLGIRKTGSRIASRYYWPRMFKDVGRYVRACESCQRFKTSQQKPAGKMLTSIPDEPWSVVCADFMGPLPRSKHGNTTLLVLVDKFSRWTELVPLRSATTEHLQKAFRERILARFGSPKVFLSDNGTQFTSRKFRAFLEAIGVRHQFTAPYTPQENATERVNRTVKTMIAQYTEGDHRGWDETLPELQLALNTAVSEVTGFSAAFLVQGREPRLPSTLFDSATLGGSEAVPAVYKGQRLQEIFQLVRHHLQVAQQQQAKYYNLRRRDWKPEIGQRVWIRDHPLSNAADKFAAKLAPKYIGPFVVTNFVSPVIVEAQLQGSRKVRRAHVQDLKPCYLDDDRAESPAGDQ